MTIWWDIWYEPYIPQIPDIDGENMSVEDNITHVAQWLESNPDHEEFEMVNLMFSTYQRTGKSQQLNAAVSLTRESRIRVVLTDEDIIVKNSTVDSLMAAFEAVPNMPIPRKRDRASVEAAVEKAIKATKTSKADIVIEEV